jgi:hypothetical protein
MKHFVFCTTGVDLTNPMLTLIVPEFQVSIQNLNLYVATEINTQIEDELRAKVHSPDGFSMLILYVYTT